MGRGIAGGILKLLGAHDYVCQVIDTFPHAPTMGAVRMRAPEFITTLRPDNGEFLRFWFSDLDNPKRQVQRAYTLMDIDYEQGEFTVYYLIHNPAGPGCRWLQQAKPGDELIATYYSSHAFTPPATAPTGYLLLADAAGIPYVNAITAQLSTSKTDVPLRIWMLEWAESDKDIPLNLPEGADVQWFPANTPALLEAFKDQDWTGWYPHMVCESKHLMPLRRYLLKELKMDKKAMSVQAYWIQGKAMGTSRDTQEIG